MNLATMNAPPGSGLQVAPVHDGFFIQAPPEPMRLAEDVSEMLGIVATWLGMKVDRRYAWAAKMTECPIGSAFVVVRSARGREGEAYLLTYHNGAPPPVQSCVFTPMAVLEQIDEWVRTVPMCVPMNLVGVRVVDSLDPHAPDVFLVRAVRTSKLPPEQAQAEPVFGTAWALLASEPSLQMGLKSGSITEYLDEACADGDGVFAARIRRLTLELGQRVGPVPEFGEAVDDET